MKKMDKRFLPMSENEANTSGIWMVPSVAVETWRQILVHPISSDRAGQVVRSSHSHTTAPLVGFYMTVLLLFLNLTLVQKVGQAKRATIYIFWPINVTCAHHYAALRGHTDIWFHFSQCWSHFSEKWAINKSKWNRWKVKVLIKRHLRIVNGQIAHVNLYKLKAALPTSAPSHHSCVTHERGNTCCLHV